MSVDIVFDTTRLDTIISGLDRRVAENMREAGEDYQEIVKSKIRDYGLVDTGRMVESVTYSQIDYRGRGHIGVLSVGAKSAMGFPYPVAQHEGWVGRGGAWYPGKPFLRDATEEYRAYFYRNYAGNLFD